MALSWTLAGNGGEVVGENFHLINLHREILSSHSAHAENQMARVKYVQTILQKFLCLSSRSRMFRLSLGCLNIQRPFSSESFILETTFPNFLKQHTFEIKSLLSLPLDHKTTFHKSYDLAIPGG